MLLKDATLLIAEDETDLLQIFEQWLKREGCRVLTASNGAAALDLARIHKPDLIVTDIRMPVMDGIELAKSLTEDEGWYLPKIVFITGFSNLDMRESLNLGIDGRLTKPLKRLDLLTVVRRILMTEDERWRRDPGDMPEDDLNLVFESLPAAIGASQIALGRGGFCITSRRAFKKDIPVGFNLKFIADGHALRGQGIVRWASHDEELAGIEITHVEEPDRAWLIELLERNQSVSFIPRSCVPDTPPDRWAGIAKP